MRDQMQPRCAECGGALAAPAPDEYLDLLSLVRERILLSGGTDLRAEDVLRPYQEIVHGSIDLHRANCPRNLLAAATVDLRGPGADGDARLPDGANGGPLGESPDADGEGASVPLTVREEEVLRLVLAGASSREIADRLYISAHTVAFHVKKLMRKFGVHSKVALVAKAALQLDRSDLSAAVAGLESDR